ncbi:MAG: HAD family hydrolase [Rickettsiales bacterium]|nr:HAD family hydrolase [Rickettsiales bacterium]
MNFAKNLNAFSKLKKSKPKAIIFDWDNTLVDTWPLIQTSIDATLNAQGRQPWGLEKVQNQIHKSMRESFPEIFGENWREAGEIYQKTYRSIHLDQIQLLPQALSLIELVAQKEILQFVVSNKIGATLRQEAKKIGVDKYFFSLIGASDADYDKPDKSPVELAFLGSDIDVNRDEVWFVGDTITDIECAHNSGCKPIIFGSGHNKISPTISIKALSELPLYFRHQQLIEILESF